MPIYTQWDLLLCKMGRDQAYIVDSFLGTLVRDIAPTQCLDKFIFINTMLVIPVFMLLCCFYINANSSFMLKIYQIYAVHAIPWSWLFPNFNMFFTFICALIALYMPQCLEAKSWPFKCLSWDNSKEAWIIFSLPLLLVQAC